MTSEHPDHSDRPERPDHAGRVDPTAPGPAGGAAGETWGRPLAAASPPRRRFSGVHLAATGVSALLVGVLATTLTFTVLGSGGDGDDGDDGEDSSAGSSAGSDAPDGGFEAPVAEGDDVDSGDDVISVGEGFTVTTWDGTEIETYVHDFSVDEACKYGQPSWEPEKEPDSRIVQLTVDVSNHGDDSYVVDSLSALTGEGYTQPVEHGFMYCNEPNDGANRWIGSELLEKGEKKLLYGAFEVRPDAAQLVLDTADNGRMLMDIPARGSSSGSGGDAPEPTTSAG